MLANTTAGIYPAAGEFDEGPLHQPVKVVLQKASHELGIMDTTGWIAVVGDNHELNIEQDYVSNQLSGEVVIKWALREGGGGASAR